MKTLYAILFLCFTAGFVYAQKTKFFELGCGSHYVISNASYKPTNLVIGLPSFSASASIGRNMRINKRLSFTYQVGVVHFTYKNSVDVSEASNIAVQNNTSLFASVAAKLNFTISKKYSVFVGAQINKSLLENKSFTYQTDTKSNAFALYSPSSKNTAFDPYKCNANLMLGFTQNLKLFNNRLAYSVQYNLGFAPYQAQLAQQQNATNNPTIYQGVQVGLIYKY